MTAKDGTTRTRDDVRMSFRDFEKVEFFLELPDGSYYEHPLLSAYVKAERQKVKEKRG